MKIYSFWREMRILKGNRIAVKVQEMIKFMWFFMLYCLKISDFIHYIERKMCYKNNVQYLDLERIFLKM